MHNINSYTIRERKYAQTKLALLNATTNKLKSKPFIDISVKELCETIPISEVTFFNYFPKKSDLIIYFIQLWMIEVTCQAWTKIGKEGGLKTIEEIFDYTSLKLPDNPFIIAEIVSFYSARREEIEFKEITQVERLLAYPEMPGIMDIPAQGFESLFMPYLENAVRLKEIPAGIDLKIIMAAIVAIFLGTPALMVIRGPQFIRPLYKKQLDWLWRGIKAEYEEK